MALPRSACRTDNGPSPNDEGPGSVGRGILILSLSKDEAAPRAPGKETSWVTIVASVRDRPSSRVTPDARSAMGRPLSPHRKTPRSARIPSTPPADRQSGGQGKGGALGG